MSIIAIDPGEEHCGVAVFSMNAESLKHRPQAMMATEMTPTRFFDWLYRSTGSYQQDYVVCEEFKLYPDKAASLSWSTLGTVEVIGVLREYCRVGSLTFVLQPASIKKATQGILRNRSIKLIGKGPHAKDAELHGWYYIIRSGLL